MIKCKAYKAIISEKTCLARQKKINRAGKKKKVNNHCPSWGNNGEDYTGWAYQACTICSIGQKIYEEHLSKKRKKAAA